MSILSQNVTSGAAVLAERRAVYASVTFFRAIVMGIIHVVTELSPVSSLGHGVLVPALFAMMTAYVAVRFLMRWFRPRRWYPSRSTA